MKIVSLRGIVSKDFQARPRALLPLSWYPPLFRFTSVEAEVRGHRNATVRITTSHQVKGAYNSQPFSPRFLGLGWVSRFQLKKTHLPANAASLTCCRRLKAKYGGLSRAPVKPSFLSPNPSLVGCAPFVQPAPKIAIARLKPFQIVLVQPLRGR